MATIDQQTPTTDRPRAGGPAPSASSQRRARSGRIRRVLLWTASVGMLAGLFALAAPQVMNMADFASSEESSGPVLHTVTRGPLRITVTADGHLESASNVEVKCNVRSWEGSKIQWIVENGTYVEKGEKIIQLDPSAIEEELQEERVEYQDARAAFAQAQQDYKAAKIAVEEYKNGLYIQQRQNLESQVEVARQDLNAAKDQLKYTKKLFRKGFSSELDLQAKKAAVRQAELALESARTALRVLNDYTKEKKLTELIAARESAKATMESAKESVKLAETEVAEEEKQLENCTIHAPQDGMVVYANEERRRSSDVQIQQGAVVEEQQTIVRLPDLTQMQADVAIHESKIHAVESGMPATVFIRDRQLDGTVKSIANQPESTSWFQADIKEYETIIAIPGESHGLRPGMSIHAEILVADMQDVLRIPVQCIVEQQGGFCCWVQTPEGPQKRRLLLGRTNDKMIEIKDGLKQGEQIYMNPRAHIPEASEGGSLLFEESSEDDEDKEQAQQGGEQGDSADASSGEAEQPAERDAQRDGQDQDQDQDTAPPASDGPLSQDPAQPGSSLVKQSG